MEDVVYKMSAILYTNVVKPLFPDRLYHGFWLITVYKYWTIEYEIAWCD